MRDVLSEVHAVVTAMGEEWVNRIPAEMWDDIIAKKNPDYAPFVDENKGLNEQGLKDETITFIAGLYMDYWCDTEEEKASLMAIFEKNEAEWKAKISSIGSVRGMLRAVHKD